MCIDMMVAATMDKKTKPVIHEYLNAELISSMACSTGAYKLPGN
jgi:hypothetical protein